MKVRVVEELIPGVNHYEEAILELYGAPVYGVRHCSPYPNFGPTEGWVCEPWRIHPIIPRILSGDQSG